MIEKSTLVLNGVPLCRVAFGTHKLGTETPDELSFALLDRYLAAGGNLIDTARCYGAGKSEECIGRWMEERGVRDRIFLMTKCGEPAYDEHNIFKRHRLNRLEMTEDIGASLEALRTKTIDLYFLHKDDPEKEPGELIEILNDFIRKGYVRAIGASNWTPARIEEANRYAAARNLCGFSASELSFSLKSSVTIDWGENSRVLELDRAGYEWYAKTQFPLFAYNAQAYGFFYRNINIDNASVEGAVGGDLAALDIIRGVCKKENMTPQQVLMGAYAASPLNVIPLVTASRPERMDDIITAANAVIPEDDMQALMECRLGH